MSVVDEPLPPDDAATFASLSELSTTGIAIIDRFADDALVGGLADAYRAHVEAGRARPARIGRDRQVAATTRGDLIVWGEDLTPTPAESRYLAAMSALKVRLNRTLWVGAVSLEWHYACYPPESGYARHQDRPRGRESRRLSAVLYLNQNWTETDGGALVLHGPHQSTTVWPTAGRLALFDSGLEHEVRPARRPRLSVTGWWHDASRDRW